MSDNKDNHGFSVAVAQEIGVNRAIMIQHFRHLQIAFVDGEKSATEIWIKRSRRALTETYPYLSEKEIRGCLDRLERDDYIRAKVDNALNYDRTKSYQLSKKGWELLGLPPSAQKANREQKASDKRANGFDKRANDNVTKGPMNIGSCSSFVTSFVEREENTPAPETQNLKEEKPKSVEVAPGENPETVKAEIPPSKKVALKKDSPIFFEADPYPREFQRWRKCFHCAGTGLDLTGSACAMCDGQGVPIDVRSEDLAEQAAEAQKTLPPNSAPPPSPEKCFHCSGSGKIFNTRAGKRENCPACHGDGTVNFEVTAIASPSPMPGVTIVDAAQKFRGPLQPHEYPNPESPADLEKEMMHFANGNAENWRDGVLERGGARDWPQEKIKKCLSEFCDWQFKTDFTKGRMSQYTAGFSLWLKRQPRFEANQPGNHGATRNGNQLPPANFQTSTRY